MEKKIKSRKLQQNMVATYIGKCKEIYENFDEQKHYTLLVTYENSIKRKLERAEEIHDEIMDVLDDEEQMLQMEEEFSEFRINGENELLILQRFIAEKNKNSTEQASVTSSRTGRNLKLPKLTIKPFDGNPLNWRTFHDTFMCSIDSNLELSNVEKMSYLINLLEGTAEQTVKGFSLSNDNYKLALEKLNERFGDEQIIITSHMNKLLELPSVDSVENTKELRNLYDIVEAQIRSLTAFDLKIENYGSFLVPVIMSKIPSEIKLIITRQLDKNTWDAKIILKTLQREIEVREKLCLSNDIENNTNKNEREDLPTGVSLYNSGKRNDKNNYEFKNRNNGRVCAFCNEKHKHQHCKNVTSIEERKNKIKRNGMCFLCLRKGHTARDCKETYSCFKCKNRHHVAICDKKNDSSSIPSNSQGTSTNNDNGSVNFTSNGNNVLLQTARAKVSSIDEKKCENLRILFDSGSQHSYISNEARKLLGLQTLSVQNLNLKVFGGSENDKKLEQVQFAVKDASGTKNIYVNAFVTEICKPLSGQTIEIAVNSYDHLKNLKLADKNPKNLDMKIDILIGSDFYWQFLTNDIVRGNGGPVAVRSALGYVLSGPISTTLSNFCGVVSTHSLKIAAEQSSAEFDLNANVEKCK